MIVPAIHNLTIYQGSTFNPVFVWKSAGAAVNLAGYTARMQVRETVGSAVKLLDLTTENSGITITAAEGKIALLCTATATAALNFVSGVWDLELIAPAGTVTRLLQGEVSLSREVTR